MYITREPLYGNFKSKFVLIKDCAEASGIKLLRGVLSALLKENVKLRIIYYEIMNMTLINKQNYKNDIAEFDAVSDPLGWNQCEESTQNLRSLSSLIEMCSKFKGFICFDSLSPLLFDNESSSVFKAFHRILNDNHDLQVVALMHSDVHSAFENQIVEKLATTVLSVIPDDDSKCFATIHYSSGKVSSQLLEYEISDKFNFSVLREYHSQNKATSSKQPDPTVNLTFNLRLKENEKEARSHLQLPYMQMQHKDVIEADIDLYDEEDPDDDLDI